MDYAHTPDALDKVLGSVRKHCHRIYGWFSVAVVIGILANVRKWGALQQWADHVIITDDNPRFENGLDIVNAILAGCKECIQSQINASKVEVLENMSKPYNTQ